MALSHSLAILTLARFLINDVSCAVIRSEKEAVELTADGEVRPAARPEARPAARVSTREIEECSRDFALGAEGGCTCEDPANHQLIDKEDECAFAAGHAGVVAPVVTGEAPFRLSSEWYHYHPKGCFKDACKEDPQNICYFFNPIGDEPAQCAGNATLPGRPDVPAPQVTGQPVCQRPRYLNGTVNVNGGCPQDSKYAVIMNETACEDAALCLGYTKGAQFLVTHANQSRYDDFPLGCFINTNDGLAYYNPQLVNWEPPKNPIGYNLCNVTETVFFAAAPAADVSVAVPAPPPTPPLTALVAGEDSSVPRMADGEEDIGNSWGDDR